MMKKSYEPEFRVGDIVRHEGETLGFVTKVQVEAFMTKVWVMFFNEKDIARDNESWYNSVELTLVRRSIQNES